MRIAVRHRSGCLLLCVCVSLLSLLLQSLWLPPESARELQQGGQPEERGGPGCYSNRRLSLRLEALNSQLQRLVKERENERGREREREREREGDSPLKRQVMLLVNSLQQDQRGLARSVRKELQRMSQRLDHNTHTIKTECEVPLDPEFPLCGDKVEFLRVQWRSDPCYAFYGVDGSTCSILTYLSHQEEFCPARPGNHPKPAWQHTPHTHRERAEVRAALSPLYAVIGGDGGPAEAFLRSRVKRMEERWSRAGERRRNSTTHTQRLQVLLYPGVLGGVSGHVFGGMVGRGGPLGELVQWADLSACLFTLGHRLTFTTSHTHLLSLIGAAPGRGSCPIQRPLTFDLIYTDYHGLAQLQAAMGLAFQHYQCRFRILDSFGTEPAFNLESYAHSNGYHTLWGSWGLKPLQYMTMFPHTPDNSFLGFVSEGPEDGGDTHTYTRTHRKENIAVVYGKQDYMWQGKEQFLQVLSEEVEMHGTVYHDNSTVYHGNSTIHHSNSTIYHGNSGTRTAGLPAFITNHGLLTQDQFLQLLSRAKLFVGLGFPYEGPAPLEAVGQGCVFLQPRFQPARSAHNSHFYKGKPTTREVSSQHPYAEDFIGRPYVWTVDMDNSTAVREAVRAILNTEVEPFTPREFTCDGMLERVHAYVTHQDFCGVSLPSWPPESALSVRLGALGRSCVSVCRSALLVCEPALFHHLNNLTAFNRLGLSCVVSEQEVGPLFPAYKPRGRGCVLQGEELLFSCAGSDPAHRRLCPCRAFIQGQIALCTDCL